MRRKKAEEARDKKESRRSRKAKRQEQEAIRRVNQSIGNVGTSRAEVYKRGRQDKSSKLNVKKIVTLLILLALIGIFIAAAADKYMTYKRENPITKVETSKTKDKAKEKTSPKTTQKKVSLEDKKKKLENIKSKLNYDEAKRLEYIIENIGSYPEDLIDLLLRNNETVDYVYSYKDKEKYNARKLAKNVTSSYHVDGEVPLFLQWDRRWGYRNYGSEMIGLSGCGPTSLAMVIRHFDSKSAVNPYDIAKYSQDNNYVSNTNTTSWKLFEDGIKKFDLQSVDVLPVEAKMKKSLDGGHVLIASLNPGLFSTRGHIIVIKGYNSDGDFLINDPNSIVNTNKAWSFDELKNYLRKIWGVSRIKSSDEDVSNSMSRGGDSTGDNEDKKQSSGGDGDSSDPSIIQDIE
ncbi:MAG: C39 family peptidase [Peptostreptococcus anaerobius]